MNDRPVLKPADLRRAVSQWVAEGCTVRIDPDGTIIVTPPGQRDDEPNQFDLIDFKR